MGPNRRVLLGSRLMGPCWRNDLCICGRNTIGVGIAGVGSPRCARTPRAGRQVRFSKRSAGVLAQHKILRGKAAVFLLAKETRQSALAFK